MKYRTVSLVLVVSLLFSAAAGFSGCGNSNTLSSITVTPLVPVLDKGTTSQLIVTAIFSNGMPVLLWSQVTWTSSAPDIATVNNAGLVTANENKTGTAVITATDIAHPELSSSVTVYVADLLSITIRPPSPPISAGTSTQFTATGLYTSESPSAWVSPSTFIWPEVDLTTLVSWASLSPEVAVIGNILNSHGTATAVSAGTTTITAAFTNVTGTATLTVLP